MRTGTSMYSMSNVLGLTIPSRSGAVCPSGRNTVFSLSSAMARFYFKMRNSLHVEASIDIRLLELRSYARDAGRPRSAGWNRPELPYPAGRGNVLPDVAVRGIRRRRDVAFVVCDVALQTGTAVCRDSCFSFTQLQ